jgi:hypothetical protein
LALETRENLPFPTFLDPLEPHKRDVNRDSVLETRAEESMHVRMGRPILAAVLVDGEDSLGSPGNAAESLLNGVT